MHGVIVRRGGVLWNGKRFICRLRPAVNAEGLRGRGEVTIKSDTSAAVAIASRRGAGMARHIEVCQLCLQEKVRRGGIKVVKVSTGEAIADALTNYVSSEIVIKKTAKQQKHARCESTRAGR